MRLPAGVESKKGVEAVSETGQNRDNKLQDRQALELDRLALENRKLALELQQAVRPDFWSWMGRLSPVVVTVLGVAGFLFGVKQYVDQQKASQATCIGGFLVLLVPSEILKISSISSVKLPSGGLGL